MDDELIALSNPRLRCSMRMNPHRVGKAVTRVALLIGGGVLLGFIATQTPLAAADTPDLSVREALESAVEHLNQQAPRRALGCLTIVERGEPHNPWLAYLRGQAYLLLGRPAAALAQLDRAQTLLSSAAMDDPELARAIASLRTLAQRRRLHIDLRSGVAYDTNVTFLDDAAASPGLIAGEQDARYGHRFSIDYAAYDDGSSYFTFGGGAAQSIHFHVEDFDFTNYEGHLSFGHRFSNHLEAELRLGYDFSRLGGDDFSAMSRVGAQLSYYWDQAPSPIAPQATHLFYQVERRDFLFATTPEFDRDGLAHFVGLEQTFQIRPAHGIDWNWNLRLAYRFGHIATDGSEFDRQEHRFGLGVTIPLIHPTKPGAYLIFPDKPLQLSLDAEWQMDRYRHASLTDADSDRRRDLISSYSLVLSQTLIDDPKGGKLVLHGIVNYSDAASNVKLEDRTSPFSYEKAVYGLQLQWSW